MNINLNRRNENKEISGSLDKLAKINNIWYYYEIVTGKKNSNILVIVYTGKIINSINTKIAQQAREEI